MEKEFDHEVRASVAEVLEYLDGAGLPEDVETALDSAQGDAKTKRVAQRILLVIEPDEEAEEASDEA
jgi:hypothetical protein